MPNIYQPVNIDEGFIDQFIQPAGDALFSRDPSIDNQTVGQTVDALGQIVNPAVLQGVPDENGLVPPPIAPPAFQDVPEVTPHDAAAARIANEQAGNGQKMMEVKTGSTTTTESQKIESQATRDAVAASDVAAEESKAAINAEGKAAAEQNRLQGVLDERSNKVVMEVENARAQVQQQNQAKFQSDLQDIDNKVTELSNFKPETFWGSKTTSDKIAASISVGLGSFAQSLTGSGQNVGMLLLQRNMSEFENNQKLEYDNKLKTIQGMRVSLDEKEQLAANAERTFDAQKLAGLAQVKSELAKGMASAKTGQVQAALQQRLAQVDQLVAKNHQEVAAKYETMSTVNTQKDILKAMPREAGMGKNGNPIKLDDGNRKARLAYADIVSANHALAKIAPDSKTGLSPEKELLLVNTNSYQMYLHDTRKRDALGTTNWAGKMVGGLWDVVNGSPKENLSEGSLLGAAANPLAAQYEDAAQAWTRGVIRYKSGAAIAHQEQNDERDQYWPVIGDNVKTLTRKAENRKAVETAMRQAGALE